MRNFVADVQLLNEAHQVVATLPETPFEWRDDEWQYEVTLSEVPSATIANLRIMVEDTTIREVSIGRVVVTRPGDTLRVQGTMDCAQDPWTAKMLIEYIDLLQRPVSQDEIDATVRYLFNVERELSAKMDRADG